MTLVLDAGAFVALERGDRAMWRRLKAEQRERRVPVTHGGVVAQVWRGGHGRQTQLARALHGVDVAGLDDTLGRKAGMLLAASGLNDAIDAGVVCLATDDDVIATSDPDDIDQLVQASERHVDIVPV